jgi:hypothetical protein
MTFQSQREVLDRWARIELVGSDWAVRKLVSPLTSALLPEEERERPHLVLTVFSLARRREDEN